MFNPSLPTSSNPEPKVSTREISLEAYNVKQGVHPALVQGFGIQLYKRKCLGCGYVH